MNPTDANFPHEEYALLIGSAGAGTARGIHSRVAASTSSIDVALADVMLDARPSGIVLPKILRRKLRLLNRINETQHASDGSEVTVNHEDFVKRQTKQTLSALDEMARVPLMDRVAHHDAKRLHSKSPIAHVHSNYDQAVENDKDDIRDHIPKNYETPISYKSTDRSRVFTCSELEKKLSKANAALLDIQKQLVRGEEIYFLDTDTHGNIYKGWEAFIDAKPEQIGIHDVESIPFDDETLLLAPTTSSAAPSRKMHADLRWFSASSYAIENGSIRKFDRKKKKSITPTRPSAFTSTGIPSAPRSSIYPPSIERQSRPGTTFSAELVLPSVIQPTLAPESLSTSALASSSRPAQEPEGPEKLQETTAEIATNKKDEEVYEIEENVNDEIASGNEPMDIDNDNENEVQSDIIQDATLKDDKGGEKAEQESIKNLNSEKDSDITAKEEDNGYADPASNEDSQSDYDPLSEGKQEETIQYEDRDSLQDEDGSKGQKRKQEDLEDDEEDDVDTRSSSRSRKRRK